MELNYRDLLPNHFDNSSRVWIYQSNRPFNRDEQTGIEHILRSFVDSWDSHGVPVKGFGVLLYNHFIILLADEKASQVSGCSTDSSVRMIREIENKFGVRMFERQTLAFVINDQVSLLPLSQLPMAISNGQVQPVTLYFDNTVQTKSELDTKWIVSVNNSWLAKKINTQQTV